MTEALSGRTERSHGVRILECAGALSHSAMDDLVDPVHINRFGYGTVERDSEQLPAGTHCIRVTKKPFQHWAGSVVRTRLHSQQAHVSTQTDG